MAITTHSTPSGVAATGLPKPRRSPSPVDPVRLRRRMERAIERMIAALDALDAETEDLEDGGDDEPTLGSTNNGYWVASCPQTEWADGGDTAEREVEDEHGGDVLDERQDEEEEEPDLGAPENPHDQRAWAQGQDERPSCLPSELSRVSRDASAAASANLRRITDRLRPGECNLIPLWPARLPYAAKRSS